MTTAEMVSSPELAPVATEAGGFMARLRTKSYDTYTTWLTRNYGPENLHPTHLQVDALSKIGAAAFVAAYAGLSYLEARYGLHSGSHATDYVLTGHTTQLAPTPHHSSGDHGGGSWLEPNTDSTRTASAVDDTPMPVQTTHPAPSPVESTHVDPSPSISASTHSPHPSPDQSPSGSQTDNDPMIDHTNHYDFKKIGGLLCLGSFAVLGLSAIGVYRHGKQVEAREAGESYSLLRRPDEA